MGEEKKEQPKEQPQEQKKDHHVLGNIARGFGNAIVFGAGATVGADAVNGAIGEAEKHD